MGVDLRVPLPRTLLQTYTIEAEDDYFDHDTLSYEQITQEWFELEPVGEGTGKGKGKVRAKVALSAHQTWCLHLTVRQALGGGMSCLP